MPVIRLSSLEAPLASPDFLSGSAKALLPLYAQRRESALRSCFEPEKGVFIAESFQVIERALDAGYEPLSFLMEESQTEKKETAELTARYEHIPFYAAPQELFANLIGANMTRGMLCMLRRREEPSAREVLRGKKRIAVLEDVVNPTNLGAVMRSAAALGIEAVLLTHNCSDPLYRRAARVSMGTVFQVPWAYLPDENWLDLLHGSGFATAAMALRDDTLDLDDKRLKRHDKLAVVLGSEGPGLREETIAGCTWRVRIPMSCGVDSLNVAAASAVAFWELCKDNTDQT